MYKYIYVKGSGGGGSDKTVKGIFQLPHSLWGNR